jgi:hypothetical protein
MAARVVHCKKEPYDVYIGRPSFWGNPFIVGKFGDRERCIQAYRELILADERMVQKAKDELRGKVLGCWCAPKACHGDVLLEIANSN